MTAPLVAISQRRDPTGPPHDEIRDALDHRLAGFVLAAGGLPLPVPSALGRESLPEWLEALRPASVLLSGGADLGRDQVRDALDLALIDYAERRELPLLGLCRGMQSLAHRTGTGLHAVAGHVARRHHLRGEIAREVNSYHAQALSGTPRGYSILGRAPDETIEAIRHETFPWEGWMWHPERESRFDPEDVARFRNMLS